jgi:SAM-dependent methyltransferase
MADRAAADFRGWTCHAPDARIQRMTEIVASSVDVTRVRRVLDIGCGGGLQLRRLAALMPNAQLEGLDISAMNIQSAEAARVHDAASARLSFRVGDYLEASFSDTFDLVVTDGVLHLIPGLDDDVSRKLATDLDGDGTLVVTMATDCLYNRGFAVLRRMLAGVRSRVTDQVILGVAKLLHRDMPETMLRERVLYMYMPPTRLMGTALLATLERHGLRLVSTHPMKRTSLSQLTHAAFVFRRA